MQIEEHLLTYKRDANGRFVKGSHNPNEAAFKAGKVGVATRFKKGETRPCQIQRGEHRSSETEFHLGMIPWNQGFSMRNLSASSLRNSFDNRCLTSPG